MLTRLLMRLFVVASTISIVAGLAFVYIDPPQGMRVTPDGVPLLSPPVIHPATGEAIPLEELVRNFKGGR
ncbi:MAG: hypothetical protein IT521_13400 [Burkholderiales bacterium]|nr:hypothetical protein [Burkholderiales bacterium]